MTQAPEAPARTRAQISERTLRTDSWWKTPRVVAAGLTIWVVYATVRVFDCNKAVSLGTGYIAAKIFIVYEDGNTEEIPLLAYSEKNELENLKKINLTINKLKSKGYFLIAQYTTGEQGNLISDYTFLKQQ